MNHDQLLSNITKHNVPGNWYSLNDGLKPDAHVLQQNYRQWEYFYLDERGSRLGYRIFFNAEDAYAHLWEKLMLDLKYPPGTPPPTGNPPGNTP